MSRRLKVAAAQLGAIHRADSRKSVVKRLVEMLKEADSRGSKFVIFPELALTTFFPRWWMESQEEVDKYFEAQMPSPETLPLFELARSKGIGFYLGYAELTEEEGRAGRFNTSILVGPDGRIVGKYRKVHLPGHAEHRPDAPYQHLEKKYFEVGNLGFNVWKMFKQDFIVGQCICNDRRWPETFRVMGLKGAEMVVLGYNTPTDNVYAPKEPPYLRVFHHNLSIQAAAYQNGIWVVATAKAGKEDGFSLHGGSAIVAPTGEIVTKTTTEEDEVISYDCDMALGEYIRNTTFNFAKHRRPEHYKLITERTGVKVEPSN
ncbi:MAG TPA: N-carbamoyl-D-amino-acid hydrolase [Reyranella sp.]|jgi:predicted amidohydrolase|nr:N-carbamoyl-D-amino-acid hydrolase [Reyranella sp.]